MSKEEAIKIFHKRWIFTKEEMEAKEIILAELSKADKLDKLEEKLKQDDKNITAKLKESKYNTILETRLKAFRTKTKEILKELEG